MAESAVGRSPRPACVSSAVRLPVPALTQVLALMLMLVLVLVLGLVLVLVRTARLLRSTLAEALAVRTDLQLTLPAVDAAATNTAAAPSLAPLYSQPGILVRALQLQPICEAPAAALPACSSARDMSIKRRLDSVRIERG